MIQKSRTALKDELLTRLSQNWQGLSTGIIGKELISLAVEVLYQANITAEALTRPLDIDTASLAELYRLAAAENIAVTPVTASTITFRWPQTAPVVRTFGIQLTNGPVSFYNISPAVPGQIITLHAGKVVGVGRNIMPVWVQSDDSPAIKFVVDSEDAITAAHQQAIIELGSDVVNGSVYVFKQNEGSSVAIAVPFTTFFMETQGTPGYRLINTRDNKTVIDVSSVTGVADTAASIPMEVIYLKGSLAATAEFKSKVKVTYCSAYNTQFDAQLEVEPISVSQGSKSVENVRRAIRAELALRQVLNNTKAVEQFCENKASINSCKAEFYEEGGKEKCKVYIKPDTIDFSTGKPYVGGRTDLYTILTANLEYYGYLYGKYTCITASPIKFKVLTSGIEDVKDQNTVLEALAAILSYDNLKIDSQLNAGQLVGQVFQETGIVCGFTFQFEETIEDVRRDGSLCAVPTQGTVNLLDARGVVLATDLNGQFPGFSREKLEVSGGGISAIVNGIGIPTSALYFVDSHGVRTCDRATNGQATRNPEDYTMLVDPIYDSGIKESNFAEGLSFRTIPNSGAILVEESMKINKVIDVSSTKEVGISYRSFFDKILPKNIFNEFILIPSEESQSDHYPALNIVQNDAFVTAIIVEHRSLNGSDTSLFKPSLKVQICIWHRSAFSLSPKEPLVVIGYHFEELPPLTRVPVYRTQMYNIPLAESFGYTESGTSVGNAESRPPTPVWVDNTVDLQHNSGKQTISEVLPALSIPVGALFQECLYNGTYLYMLVRDSFYNFDTGYRRNANEGSLQVMRIYAPCAAFNPRTSEPGSYTPKMVGTKRTSDPPSADFYEIGNIKDYLPQGRTFRGKDIYVFHNGELCCNNESWQLLRKIKLKGLQSGIDLDAEADFKSVKAVQSKSTVCKLPKWKFVSSPQQKVYLFKSTGYSKKQDGSWELPEVYYAELYEGATQLNFTKIVPDTTKLLFPWGEGVVKETERSMSVFFSGCDDTGIDLMVINSWQHDSEDNLGYVRNLIHLGTDGLVRITKLAEFSRNSGTNAFASDIEVAKEGMFGSIDYDTGKIVVPTEVGVVSSVKFSSTVSGDHDSSTYFYYDE